MTQPQMQKRLTVYFSGTVQGVGFRYTTERTATRFPVTGFVRNLPDSRVEVVAEGPEEALKSFLKTVRESNLSDYIRDMETEWGPAQGSFKAFSIRY